LSNLPKAKPAPEMARKGASPEPVVAPVTNITGRNPLERKAFTVERSTDPTKPGWCFVTITYVEDKIVHIERSEPDLKPVCLEKFKVTALRYWISF